MSDTNTVVQRLVSLDSASFNSSDLGQLHQLFLSCSVETRLVVEAIKYMRFVKETCCLAFEGKQTKSSPSATQQQVSETLRLGLSVEDEVRCPRSGYSIDMLDSALEIGGEKSSRGGLVGSGV